MLKFIHISDTHLPGAGTLLLYGISPHERLSSCFAHIKANHSDAAFIVISGDVAENGEEDAYSFLQSEARQLNLPVLVIPGNHDRQAAMQSVLPPFHGQLSDLPKGGAFLASALHSDDGLFIFLDSSGDNISHGVFAGARVISLTKQLTNSRGDIFLFMHHPPFQVGIPFMDIVCLLDPEPLYAALTPHKGSVRHMFFGHLHKTVNGTWRGIPFSIVRSTVHQIDAQMNLHNSNTDHAAIGCDEQPEYSVVIIHQDRVVCRAERFIEESKSFFL
jgi:3',5'-cyclic AMP phosphodiesterase CpdA